MPTVEEAGPSRAGGTDHEYLHIHEQIGLHTVVPFKQALMELVTVLYATHCSTVRINS